MADDSRQLSNAILFIQPGALQFRQIEGNVFCLKFCTVEFHPVIADPVIADPDLNRMIFRYIVCCAFKQFIRSIAEADPGLIVDDHIALIGKSNGTGLRVIKTARTSEIFCLFREVNAKPFDKSLICTVPEGSSFFTHTSCA